MIINMTGGGGGAALNFDVVGGTSQPSNPKENTIWVNTSTAITDWVFSATQPTSASGKVWIHIGTSSAVEFNALKKNGIQVYPILAKQYVSGAWRDVVAKSYQGGEWVSWFQYFFKSGEGACFGIGFSRESDNVTVTIKDDIIAVVQKNTIQSMSRVYTDPFDLTYYSKIYLELVCTVGNAGFPGRFAVSKTKPAWQSDSATWAAIQTLPVSSNIQIAELDVSALTGEYYISFGGSVDCDIYNWWTE